MSLVRIQPALPLLGEAMSDELNPESAIYEDDVALERELRRALRGEDEIILFKKIQQALQVDKDLQDSATIREIVQQMWGTVAEFFDQVAEANTLQGLEADDKLVILHKDMQANFRCVATINAVFKESKAAEEQLIALDDMDAQATEPE